MSTPTIENGAATVTAAARRLPTEVKIVGAVVFTFVVVATPREAMWAFALYFSIVAAVCVAARIRLSWLLPRMSIELPFLVLAVLLPFAESGTRVEWLGLSLSVPGLYAAWGIVVKGTLGVLASLILAATTPVQDLPGGLTRLHVPPLITTVVLLMLRYATLLAAEAKSMDIARRSRGDDPRMLHRIGATARGVGSLFVRAYERGERVHWAMLSRGFTGAVPATGSAATRTAWAFGLMPAALAGAVCAAAWGGL
ncbi:MULTISPECIES: cobalt ECF transporter T component CbiQ [unclassified Rhodococcus (in: high G+C Gram-positive bacteria)]|uniref:cobalt ECF transporter T component CbiQ n=1 Tax=unclassified Rhodococcus (in: high G+C Gram-positive bacteria) TaxID=192944 RepID=UPI001469D025|nr:cobalt ECF transporter T component CbiQ [Rhodococcus sp. BL-253-APC-6A1W]NME80410.1 cobalt ECF transporter T component CbiQ [Rhodococcus sp. 105337]